MSVPSKQFPPYFYKEHKEFAVKQAQYFDTLKQHRNIHNLNCLFFNGWSYFDYYRSLFNY